MFVNVKILAIDLDPFVRQIIVLWQYFEILD